MTEMPRLAALTVIGIGMESETEEHDKGNRSLATGCHQCRKSPVVIEDTASKARCKSATAAATNYLLLSYI
jgi:hypothetical protein